MEKSDGNDSSNMRMRPITIDKTLLTMPLGYRFVPLKKELVWYLHAKLRNSEFNCHAIIEEKVYKYHPGQLAEKYSSRDENALYFFSPRDRKYKQGKRPTRAAGRGFWKANGEAKDVEGTRCKFRTLAYYEGKHPGTKTNWIMHEYVDDEYQIVISKHTNSMKLDNWVLCKIHYNHNKGSKTDKNKQLKQEESSRGQAQSPNQGHVTEEATLENEAVHQIPSDMRPIDQGKRISIEDTNDKNVFNSMPYAMLHYPAASSFPSVAPLNMFNPNLQDNTPRYNCQFDNSQLYESGESSQNTPQIFDSQFDAGAMNSFLLDNNDFPQDFNLLSDESRDFEMLYNYAFGSHECISGSGEDFPTTEKIENGDEFSSFLQNFKSRSGDAYHLQECSNTGSSTGN